jgi:hypothetical protein
MTFVQTYLLQFTLSEKIGVFILKMENTAQKRNLSDFIPKKDMTCSNEDITGWKSKTIFIMQ